MTFEIEEHGLRPKRRRRARATFRSFDAQSRTRGGYGCYANVEIDYLLQQMENYAGLVILTTNVAARTDAGSLRHLRLDRVPN